MVDQSKEDISDCKGLRTLPWQPNFGQNRPKNQRNGHNFSCMQHVHAEFGLDRGFVLPGNSLNYYQHLCHIHHMAILESSAKHWLLTFSTYHNLGFIHIYSHTFILHLFFHSLSLLIKSSVSAVKTKSSA